MAEFRNLVVWHKAYALSLDADRVASTIRGFRHSGLRSQITRSAFSIPTNIVEGRARLGEREFAQFVGYAIASATELEFHVLSARDRKLISDADYDRLTKQIVQVRKMLYGLQKALRKAEADTGKRRAGSTS